MAPDSWSIAYEPLAMLDDLREPPAEHPECRRERHTELLNTYTLRCLIGIGADSEADVFRDIAFGPPRHEIELAIRTNALRARASGRRGGFSGGGRYRIPVEAQRAQATLAAINALGGYDGGAWWAAVAVTRETRHQLQREQCEWLRCLFPNPRTAVAIDSRWLTSTVVGLARGIAAENAFDRLPILADALQDADCDHEELLHHCRHGTHGMHCWAVSELHAASGSVLLPPRASG